VACSATLREPGRRPFRVYVLALPDGRLYVGSTAKPLAERIAEHRMRYGRVTHRRDLSPGTVCMTRDRAERVERRTAQRLRAKGWEVEQG
jgi:predicted GIY-YIG superfamily endonuclease